MESTAHSEHFEGVHSINEWTSGNDTLGSLHGSHAFLSQVPLLCDPQMIKDVRCHMETDQESAHVTDSDFIRRMQTTCEYRKKRPSTNFFHVLANLMPLNQINEPSLQHTNHCQLTMSSPTLYSCRPTSAVLAAKSGGKKFVCTSLMPMAISAQNVKGDHSNIARMVSMMMKVETNCDMYVEVYCNTMDGASRRIPLQLNNKPGEGGHTLIRAGPDPKHALFYNSFRGSFKLPFIQRLNEMTNMNQSVLTQEIAAMGETGGCMHTQGCDGKDAQADVEICCIDITPRRATSGAGHWEWTHPWHSFLVTWVNSKLIHTDEQHPHSTTSVGAADMYSNTTSQYLSKGEQPSTLHSQDAGVRSMLEPRESQGTNLFLSQGNDGVMVSQIRNVQPAMSQLPTDRIRPFLDAADADEGVGSQLFAREDEEKELSQLSNGRRGSTLLSMSPGDVGSIRSFGDDEDGVLKSALAFDDVPKSTVASYTGDNGVEDDYMNSRGDDDEEYNPQSQILEVGGDEYETPTSVIALAPPKSAVTSKQTKGSKMYAYDGDSTDGSSGSDSDSDDTDLDDHEHSNMVFENQMLASRFYHSKDGKLFMHLNQGDIDGFCGWVSDCQNISPLYDLNTIKVRWGYMQDGKVQKPPTVRYHIEVVGNGVTVNHQGSGWLRKPKSKTLLPRKMGIMRKPKEPNQNIMMSVQSYAQQPSMMPQSRVAVVTTTTTSRQLPLKSSAAAELAPQIVSHSMSQNMFYSHAAEEEEDAAVVGVVGVVGEHGLFCKCKHPIPEPMEKVFCKCKHPQPILICKCEHPEPVEYVADEHFHCVCGVGGCGEEEVVASGFLNEYESDDESNWKRCGCGSDSDTSSGSDSDPEDMFTRYSSKQRMKKKKKKKKKKHRQVVEAQEKDKDFTAFGFF